MAAPVVITNEATFVGETSATLNGYCSWTDPTEPTGYVIFQWGKTARLGEWTDYVIAKAGKFYSHKLTGLNAATTYQYWCVGRKVNSYFYGDVKTFTTLVAALPPPVPPVPPVPPAPVPRAIKKPSWLSRALDLLNWDIFTWKVYIGDAIERAVDWALGWVNWGIDQATLAWNKAVAAWDKALEVYQMLRSWVNTELQKANNLIDAAKSFLNERINDVRTLLNRLDIAWDNFKRDTLPKLLDTQWVRDFFGRGINTISDWGAARIKEVGDLIDTEVTPVREEVNKHSSWLDLIKELFTDPEKWLMDRIESMLARFL